MVTRVTTGDVAYFQPTRIEEDEELEARVFVSIEGEVSELCGDVNERLATIAQLHAIEDGAVDRVTRHLKQRQTK